MTHSNKKSPVAELVDENISLNRKNAVKSGLIVFLAVLGGYLSVSSNKKSADLEKAEKRNDALIKAAYYFQQDSQKVALENIELRRYANDAKSFANSIHAPYPDLVDGKTAEEEKAIETKYKKELKAYDDACKVLGIDQEQLFRLQKGLEK